ncbi:MAG: acyltransferase [Phycisphaerales bacterium]|nr:acyltransferase [Phycisphaerales bacterium]
MFEPRIDGVIEADELKIGRGVVVEKGTVITGKGGPARRVVLGDFCYIGEQCKIIVPEFRLGDYSKLNAYAFCHGYRPLQIGRNCWFGGNVVLDSIGGLDIDDNVGIGAHSQVWTHIQFGDVVEGSRFHSSRYMLVGKDAWLVGHCLVSPVRIGERSMAMLGSVVTRDMLPNHVYAGVPAKDMTDKLGPQFERRTIEQKAAVLEKLIAEFVAARPEFAGQLRVVGSPDERRPDVCCFDVSRRTYNKGYRPAEVAFLKQHTPLVKFVPDGEPPFITPQDAVPPFDPSEYA